jgi:hypothetical protein
MRKSFDSSVPYYEQLWRSRIGRKVHTGRRHTGAPKPGAPVRGVDPRLVAKARRHKDEVAAYFRGERDELP